MLLLFFCVIFVHIVVNFLLLLCIIFFILRYSNVSFHHTIVSRSHDRFHTTVCPDDISRFYPLPTGYHALVFKEDLNRLPAWTTTVTHGSIEITVVVHSPWKPSWSVFCNWYRSVVGRQMFSADTETPWALFNIILSCVIFVHILLLLCFFVHIVRL
jgi:hypothetical protein